MIITNQNYLLQKIIDTCTIVIITTNPFTDLTLARADVVTIEATIIPTDFALAAGDTSGRKLVLNALNGLTVSGTGTADHVNFFATNGTHIHTGEMLASISVVDGEEFALNSFDVLELLGSVNG